MDDALEEAAGVDVGSDPIEEESVETRPEDTAIPEPEVPRADWRAAYTAMVRLGAGMVGTVLDRAYQAAAAPPEEPEVAPDATTSDGNPIGSVLFGLAADLPDRIGRVTGTVAESSGPVRGLASWGWRVTAASPVGWVISKPVEAVRERVDAEAQRLAEIGRNEYAQGRVLFETVVDNTIDGVLDNVSESDALNELIREQALGIGDAAIQEVRETGAAVDSRTDAIVRKLLRREPRRVPPMPANGAE